MSSNLIKPPGNTPAVPVPQQAEKINNFQHVDTVNQTNQVFLISGGIPGMPGSTSVAVRLSKDYYNLIVWGDEPFFDYRHVTIGKDRALVETSNITPELKKWLSPLSEEAISALKSFPCIIANENHFYGHTDEEQYAVLAVITDIKNRSNGVEVYFHPFHGLQQQRLNELRFELGIEGTTSFNEFNHSHWTVKEIDLLEVLAEHGLKQI